MTTVSQATRAFFSFPQVLDPDRHADYNEWHQLDHLPENRALPGVVHGERWVRSPDCRAASAVDEEPTLSAAQYVAMYWFAEPVGPAIEEWLQLGASTEQEGRRPELAWTERRLTGFFRPLRGYVDPAAAVSVDALPFRPARGVLLEAHRVDEPRTAAADAAIDRWHKQVAAAVDVAGVVGAWTFLGRRVSLNPTEGAAPADLSVEGALLLTLHWCEDDPVEVALRIGPPVGVPGLTPLLHTPLRTITPWQWDWFDAAQ